MEYSLPSQRVSRTHRFRRRLCEDICLPLIRFSLQQYPSATPQISRPWTQSQLSPQNTSAVRSTVEPSRSEHDVGVTSGPLYPLQNRFPTPAGRWMDPMMIRPIDSSYPSGSGAPPALDNHGPLLPSPFPPPSVHGQQFNSALPPLQPQFSGRDYYNPTPPSSASTSSSTSPSSMSSRSIDTLDSPITLQQTAQPSRYNHQHHHSDPYIYQSPAYSQDDLFQISRGPTFSQTSYAPYVVPLNPEVYDSGEGSNASSQTIDSFNSSLASSSPSTSRRKHRPSYSVGGGDEFDAFSQGLRTPRGARSKPSSPTTSRMSSVSPYQRRGPPVSRSSMSTLPFESAPLLTLDSSEGGSVSATGLRAPKPSVVHPFRTLPAHVQIDPQFPLLYRQFYVSSYFAPSDPLGNHVFAQQSVHFPFYSC
ncbi:hypothetical protein DL93DRAFT_193590 [Clavulina sp. PMI_390]|nr:hypothetical protein DL93DRAFT_193590 [Clavulina sp. PMI_390]